ncbi:MAG: peptidoglycan-binding protein [Proteobacteria bacterium]|nr:peptidoglycan-binding protein [Pseudomonadota bacterium]MBU1710459.1 peptidoglycan-binding protein [Pseudomonadota bacterium]
MINVKYILVCFLGMFLILFDLLGIINTALAANANVQRTQQILIDYGYRPGPADGLFGLKTRAALMQYQKDKHLPETGQIDKKTAIALGVDIYTPKKKQKYQRENIEARQSQSMLMWLGHYTGPINGVTGPETIQAINRFQVSQRTTDIGGKTIPLVEILKSAVLARDRKPKLECTPDVRTSVRLQSNRLFSSNAVERALAAYELGKMREDALSAIPCLLNLLDDRSSLEWRQPGQVINSSGESTSPSKEAAHALSKMGSKGNQALIAAFYVYSLDSKKHPNIDILDSVMEGLNRIEGNDAVDVMVDALFSDRVWDTLKILAGEYLARTKDSRILEPLSQIVIDRNKTPKTTQAAALALGELRDPRAIDPLIKAMWLDPGTCWNTIQNVRILCPTASNSADALKKITDLDFGHDRELWRSWRMKNPD